jgi:hypothetical protein
VSRRIFPSILGPARHCPSELQHTINRLATNTAMHSPESPLVAVTFYPACLISTETTMAALVRGTLQSAAPEAARVSEAPDLCQRLTTIRSLLERQLAFSFVTPVFSIE